MAAWVVRWPRILARLQAGEALFTWDVHHTTLAALLGIGRVRVDRRSCRLELLP